MFKEFVNVVFVCLRQSINRQTKEVITNKTGVCDSYTQENNQGRDFKYTKKQN